MDKIDTFFIYIPPYLPPPPPKKKEIQEGENAAFWPSCGFIIDFARKYWGGGGLGGCCFKIVDQTRKCMTVLQPSATSEDC